MLSIMQDAGEKERALPEDQNRTVTLARVRSELEAALLLEILHDAGIDAEQSGGWTSGFRAEAPGYVDVLVHADDIKAARDAIEAAKAAAADIDWDNVDLDPDDENP